MHDGKDQSFRFQTYSSVIKKTKTIKIIVALKELNRNENNFFLKIAEFHPNTLATMVNILPLAQESSGFSTVGLSRLKWNILRLNLIGVNYISLLSI